MILIKCVSVLFLIGIHVNGDDPQYGAFDIIITKAEVCHGPKVKNCGLLKIAPVTGGRSLEMSLDVLEDVKPEVAKIMVSKSGQQKSATPLFRMRMDKPCEHVFLRPMFTQILNLTANCIVKKGLYISHVDVAKVAEDYFAGKFMFGNFTFKSVFTSKKCNFSCALVYASIAPK